MNSVLPPDRLTLAQAARLIRARRLSPVELMESCLARIEQFEPHVNAFAAMTAESALAGAHHAETEIAGGVWRGPLHGIPVGIKDVIDVSGVPTRAQSRQMEDYVPLRNAASVARWLDAGALSLGKLTTHEFAFGSPDPALPRPPARNPWHTAHFSGGSSSGAAVGVACGMVLGALGSDTAGSVRSPAALCGMSGFKPGRACVNRRGTLALAPSLDALGVIAGSVEDCAMLFLALVEPAVQRAVGVDISGYPQLDAEVRGLRIGVVRNFFDDEPSVNTDCRAAVDAARMIFEDAGYTLTEVSLPPLAQWHAAGMVILLAEAFALHEYWLRTRIDLYGRSFSDAVLLGAAISAADYVHAVQMRRALTVDLDATMGKCDLLLAPIQAGEAPLLGALSQWGFLQRPSYGLPFNLSDNPALSLCCGFGKTGLPLAMQLIGRRGSEGSVLRAGYAYQRRTDWHRRLHLSGKPRSLN